MLKTETMMKYLLTTLLALTVLAVNAQTSLTLTTSMLSGGSADELVDEQSSTGNLMTSSGETVSSILNTSVTVSLDLGQEYALTDIFLFDANENEGAVTISAGSAGNWMSIATDDMTGYDSWNQHKVTVTTQFVQIRTSANSGLGEIVLYGTAQGVVDTQAPTVPANLQVASTQETSVSLSWTASTDNVGVTGYKVYQNGSLVSTVSTTIASISGLTGSTNYSFTVLAVDAAGNESAQSTALSVTTLNAPDTQAPTAPSNLVSSNVSTTSASLVWTQSTDNVGVTAYKIYQDSNYLTTVTGTSHNLTGLSQGTYYMYYVIAEDAAGNESSSSNQITVLTQTSADTQAPTVPSNLSASGTSTTTTNLSWTASTDNVGVTGYKVYQDGVAIATIQTTNYNVTGLMHSTTYSFVVTAVDAANNESSASTAASVITSVASDTQAPSIPSSPSASGTSTTTTNLSWTASTDNVGVTGYRIYQDGTLLTTITQTTYQVTGLTHSTTYNFTITAIDAQGNESTPTAQIPVTTTVAADTEAPTVVTLSSNSVSTMGVTLTWTTATDNIAVTGYKIYQDAQPTAIATVTGTSYQVTGLLSSTSYSFTVAAIDNAGNEAVASNQENITTQTPADTQAPSAPVLTLGAVSETTVNLSWTTSTDNVAVTGYKIYRDGTAIATVATTSYQATGLSPATAYSFTLTAIDAAANESTVSNAVSATTDAVVDTQAPSVPTGLAVSNETTTGLSLTWTASTDNVAVTGYKIYQDNVEVKDISTLTTNITGLTAGTTYAFKVLAYDAATNESAQSAAVNGTTNTEGGGGDVILIPLTTSMIGSQVGTTAENLVNDQEAGSIGDPATGTGSTTIGKTDADQWKPGVAPASFVLNLGEEYDLTDIYFCGGNDPSAQSVVIEVGASASGPWTTVVTYDPLGLWHWSTAENINQTAQYLKFSLTGANWDKSGLSEIALYGSPGAPDTTAPTVPSGLNATALGSSSIRITWTASTDDRAVTEYEIYKNGALAGISATEEFLATGLTESTEYSFTVLAKDAAGNASVQSSAAAASTTAPDLTPPTNPSGLTTTTTSSSTLGLTWTGSTDNIAVAGYDIYVDNVNTKTVTGTSATLTGLTASTTYAIKVKAVDGSNNESGFSNSINATTDVASASPCLYDGHQAWPAIPASEGYIKVHNSKYIYDVNEPITFVVVAPDDGDVNWTTTEGTTQGPVIQTGTVYVPANTPIDIVVNAMDHPTLLNISVNQGGNVNGGGVSIDPCNIQGHGTEPADFESFWNGYLDQLALVPINARITARQDLLDPTWGADTQYYMHKFIIDQIDGREVWGYLSIPQSGGNAQGKFPAVLNLPAFGGGRMPYYAGDTPPAEPLYVGGAVYPSDRAINVSINIHDVDIETTNGSYDPNNYEDKDEMYFRWAMMASIRAIDFIYSLPEFDGEHLIVKGKSQGGGLTLLSAGLEAIRGTNRVDAIAACVPAWSDHNAYLDGMPGGWPRILWTYDDNMGQPEKMPLVAPNLNYYDAVNFCKRITVPSYLMSAYYDSFCPGSTVFAAYNAIPDGNKSIEHGWTMTHDWYGNWLQKFEDFFNENFDNWGIPANTY